MRRFARLAATVALVGLSRGVSLTAQTCDESPIIIATGTVQTYKFTKKADGVLFDIDADGVASTSKNSSTE